MAQPYERQEGESSRQFAAYLRYQAMPPEVRSLSRMCRRGRTGRIAIWCRDWRWVSRSQAWDSMIAEKIREAEILERIDMARRHARDAVSLQEKALQRLAELNPKELSAADVLRYLESAQKLERLARGEPESVTERRNGDTDLFARIKRRAAELDSSGPGIDVHRNRHPQSIHPHQADVEAN
jgi:hypothetical protein